MFERWHWDLVQNVDPMDFEDFILLADVVQHLDQRDMKSRQAAMRK